MMKSLLLTLLVSLAGSSVWADEHYLVGGCTASGWNTGEDTRSPVAMMKVSENTWIWCGKLTTGDGDDGRFKIPNGINNWDGYWAPEQGKVLTSEWSDLSTDGTGDQKFCVSEAGIYKVTIDTSNDKIKAEKLTEPGKEGDYYLLSTVEDYYWFAGSATSGEQGLKARLTTNLNFAEKGFYPLGSDKESCRFKGEFDGQGHTMTGISIEGSYNKLAPFRSIDAATIKNLRIEGTVTTKNYQMGGLVGLSRGSSAIQNVFVDVTLTSSHSGDGTHGGVIAVAHDVPTIVNVAFVGSINASADNGSCGMIGYAHSGGSIYYTNCFVGGTLTLTGNNNRVFGRNGEYCRNCYTTLSMTKLNNDDRFDGAVVTSSQVESGELAYKLNGNSSEDVSWYQAIGTDAYPVPFGTAVVYANGNLNCDGTSKGEAVYSNVEGSTRDAHDWTDWGFCSKCNDLQPDFMVPNDDDVYEISTDQQLNWFAHRVNGYGTVVASYGLNGKLTADIDFSDQAAMIGGDGLNTAYRGTFDGQGHQVKLGYNVSQKNVALFRTIAGAHILNLITDGTITNESNSCAAGIFGGSHGASVVENCVSYVSINRGEHDGDATFGGIGAYMHDTGKILNCAFYGAILAPNATGNGGLLGYANGGNNIAVENCVVNAKEFTFNSNSVSVARNTGNVTNVYVVNAGTATQKEQIAATAEQLASGELCYLLNNRVSGGEKWYQLIDTDAAPLPLFKENAMVYVNGSFYCDGEPQSVSYANVSTGDTYASHNFTDGICVNEHDGIVCGDANPDYLTLADGYYELSAAKELKWFAAFVNKGHGDDAHARLTADIDMSDVSFPGIGNAEHNYAGTFDGQKHKISHLAMNLNQQGVGLVARAGNGVCLKNLTIDNTCSFDGTEGVAAFIGGTYGDAGMFTIENCGNEATVHATSKNAGALIGCNYGNNTTVVAFKNSYNTGAISSTAEGGALSGWVHNNSQVVNCYNTGELTGCEGFIRGYGETITNCYSTSNDKSGTYGRSADHAIESISDGTVFAQLHDYNENGVDGSVWQMEFSGTAHPVLYDAALVLKEDFPNRPAAGRTGSVAMFRTIQTGGWNTFCVPFDMSAAQIASYFGNATEVAQLKSNAPDDDVLHFELTNIIEAGKAYLVYPAAASTSKDVADVTIAATTPDNGTTQAGFTYKGVFEPTTLNAGTDRIVAGGNSIVKTSGGQLKGFRAYFTPESSNARATSFVIDETEATGIITAEGEVLMGGAAYNVQGQRVNGNAHGLMISNGKKFMVK